MVIILIDVRIKLSKQRNYFQANFLFQIIYSRLGSAFLRMDFQWLTSSVEIMMDYLSECRPRQRFHTHQEIHFRAIAGSKVRHAAARILIATFWKTCWGKEAGLLIAMSGKIKTILIRLLLGVQLMQRPGQFGPSKLHILQSEEIKNKQKKTKADF